MKEYDLCVSLYYNDGRPVAPQKFQVLQQQLLDQFGGLTFFPQPNAGFWTMAGITYRDEIVIYRVITSDEQEARQFLSALKERLKTPAVQAEGVPPVPSPPNWSPLADEAEVLRWCIAWLEQLEHEDHVVVNLRPAGEDETEFVPFDRPRVVRVLARIVAHLDALARPSLACAAEVADSQEERRVRHRQRLAEPEPPLRRLSRWEERAASRQALGLPPYERS